MLLNMLFLFLNTKNLNMNCLLFYLAPKHLPLPFWTNIVHTRQGQQYAVQQT